MAVRDVQTCHPALLLHPQTMLHILAGASLSQPQGGGTVGNGGVMGRLSCRWPQVCHGIYPTSFSCSSLVAAPCLRNVDRPELCQVSLYDFQKFLLHDQKVGFP